MIVIIYLTLASNVDATPNKLYSTDHFLIDSQTTLINTSVLSDPIDNKSGQT